MLAPISTRLTVADGVVEGYASLFGEIDQARDMVMPGAFAGADPMSDDEFRRND